MDIHSLKENARHGTVIFPLALYEWNGIGNCGAGNWRVPLHWHDEMELIYFKEGTFQTWLNTKEFLIESPALMCIHAGELHSLILGTDCLESAVVFNLNILSFEHYDAIQAKLIRPLMDGRLRLPVLIGHSDPAFSHIKGHYEKMEAALKEMNACSPEDEITKNSAYLQIKLLLFDMLALLYKTNSLIHVKNIHNENEHQIENLKKVLSYINEQYASPICLDELASLVNLNTQYFCRYFKENIGKTTTEYINEVRIEKAAAALLETKSKIITIAQDAGFDNIGYFIRRFKQIKGVTPSEYRTEYQKESKSQNNVINQ
ncbi:MAG: AraC family transcriptional regulator [Lachnospiraceae bacterium]|nr:AraC family transcriptional regulator [Lachnospiraceae bacterium]